MKRILIMFLCVSVLFVNTCLVAHATGSGVNPLTAGPYYEGWSKMFGATDFDSEIKSEGIIGDSQNSALYCDDLTVVYNKQTLKTEYCLWYNVRRSADFSDQNIKLLGLFAAFECGSPSGDGSVDAYTAFNTAMSVYKAYISAIMIYGNELRSGESFNFWSSEIGNYYVFYDEACGYCITVK